MKIIIIFNIINIKFISFFSKIKIRIKFNNKNNLIFFIDIYKTNFNKLKSYIFNIKKY